MTTKEQITVYFTMVHTPEGVKRIGNAYASRKAAPPAAVQVTA
jgi:hypothetical protein